MRKSLLYRSLQASWILLAFFPAVPAVAVGGLQAEVVAALEWALPVNECSKPRLIAQSSNVVDGAGAREITDVDSYAVDRYKRKGKR